jgi:hypothetical protein
MMLLCFVKNAGQRVLKPKQSAAVFLVVRAHPIILQLDFTPSIIILFGKHNVVGSQKNYKIALQKKNNLLALCLTEQHCQNARSYPFSTIHV